MLSGRVDWRSNMLALLVLGLMVTRILLICLAKPIVAYANNYDFVRQSSCVGIWENYGDKDKSLKNPQRPVNALIVDRDRRPDVCMRSSDNIIPWLVGRVVHHGAHVELRAIGLIKVLITLALAGFIVLQPTGPAIRLALSAVAFLNFGDFAVLCYYNTLYLDASLVIFFFASMALTAVVYCRRSEPGLSTLCVLLAALSWFTCAKLQYAPLAAVTGVIAAVGFWVRWQARYYALITFGSIVLIQGAFYGFILSSNNHTENIDRANLADTFLGAVLPTASDKAEALRAVGLPPACQEAIGKDWYYSPVQQGLLCPEVFHTSRTRLLRLFAADPRTFVEPLVHGVRSSRPFLLTTVGHFERPSDSSRWRYRLIEATSLSTWLACMPTGLYFTSVLFLGLACPFLLVIPIVRLVRIPQIPSKWLAASLFLGLGGLSCLYAVPSAVFGDGYGDLERHCIGILIGVSFAAGAAVLIAAESRPVAGLRLERLSRNVL